MKASDLACFSTEQLACLKSAIERKALLLSIDGRPYAAVLEAGVGWWVYELKYSSTEYFVVEGKSCTCQSEHRPCKHMTALKYNPATTASWPNRRVQRRRVRQRGER
jgi:hypothetical protein